MNHGVYLTKKFFEKISKKYLTRNKLRVIIYTEVRKMPSISSREILKKILADGWYEVNCVGDHHQFKHPTKKGKVTITHPVKDVPLPTVKSIEKQSGVKLI